MHAPVLRNLAYTYHLFCAVLYCHLWPIWRYQSFPHYLINGTIGGGGVKLNTKMYLYFHYNSRWSISHFQRDIIVNVRSSWKIYIMLCQIWIKLEFSLQILKNPQISNVMKIRPVGAEVFHQDRQTYRRTDTTRHDMTRHFFPHLMQSVTHNYISRRTRRTERAASMSEVRNFSNIVI